MTVFTVDGKDYRLPDNLNPFQSEMYVHLINWKWKHNITEPGYYKYKGRLIPYDAILPRSLAKDFPTIYPPVVKDLKYHREKYPFRLHTHFNHMASSQAANINLFLPVLLNPKATEILSQIKGDFAGLATDQLDKGFRIEFWDREPLSDETGLLGDHSQVSGTDTDIAIAYKNYTGDLCLWLIEHKLTESKFTTCGGYKSDNRKKMPEYDCSLCFADLLKNKKRCYYHGYRGFNYWNITESNVNIFVNHDKYTQCPFRSGLNQLWRNHLLALAIENDTNQPYKHVYFSVVRHPRNKSLDESIEQYKNLTANNPKLSAFTSKEVIESTERLKDPTLNEWIDWYSELYNL